MFLQKPSEKPIARLPKEFLSFSIDLAQVLGKDWWSKEAKTDWNLIGSHQSSAKTKPFDFTRSTLIKLTKSLSPAYIKIGGAKADHLSYFQSSNSKYNDSVLTKAQLSQILNFCKKSNLKLIFTLNAGLGQRDSRKRWLPDNAQQLINHTKNSPVKITWKLGGEINAFITNGIKWRITGKQYAKDITKAKQVLPKNSKLIAASSAFWPIIGEPFPILKSILKNNQTPFSILGFHYYPQQSTRSPIQLTTAKTHTLLNPKRLDRFDKITKKISRLKKRYLPNAELWLTETGNAQCGGQPGISDAFVGSLWWTDQLGLAAQNNLQVVIRQTLAGANYGLIDEETLKPNPDYWASILWKKLMGPEVYMPKKPKNKLLRIYTHSTTNKKSYTTTLLINLSKNKQETINLPKSSDVYLITSQTLQSKKICCNKRMITSEKDLKPITEKSFILPPTSYVFVTTQN